MGVRTYHSPCREVTHKTKPVQFFPNMVEFDMNVQQAVEAANINSMQMRGSFGEHATSPGRLLVQNATPLGCRPSLSRWATT